MQKVVIKPAAMFLYTTKWGIQKTFVYKMHCGELLPALKKEAAGFAEIITFRY
jgi:hypothetical protein